MNLLNVRNFNDQTGAAHKKNSNLFQIKFFGRICVNKKCRFHKKKVYYANKLYNSELCININKNQSSWK